MSSSERSGFAALVTLMVVILMAALLIGALLPDPVVRVLVPPSGAMELTYSTHGIEFGSPAISVETNLGTIDLPATSVKFEYDVEDSEQPEYVVVTYDTKGEEARSMVIHLHASQADK